MFQTIRMFTGNSRVNELLAKHFQRFQLATLVTAARGFHLASRVDVEVALDAMLLNGWSRMVGGWYGQKEAIAQFHHPAKPGTVTVAGHPSVEVLER